MLSALLVAAAVAYAHPEQLVDTAWLAAHAGDAGVRVLDLRRSGYAGGHIPEALALDPESIRDARNPPTFLPTPEAFGAMMGRLGIGNETHVILYDDRGGLLATRLWWMLSYFGHTNTALVDGGWVKWTAEGRPTTTDVPTVPGGRFIPRPAPRWLATADDVLAAIGKSGVRLIDARTTGEIDGSDTRNSKRPGLIPSAVPVYWEDLLDSVRKTFRPAEELQAVFTSHGIVPSQEVIAYCQVGHRSSVDLFALHLLGYDKLRNYLGSWEEWGNRPELPVALVK
jgi:thiosulfate/3-mercaptopyruvate sulfurtransferase